MLRCQNTDCPSRGLPEARFERREYVRQEIIVDRHDEPANDEGVLSDPLGAERTYRCLSCGGHDVVSR